MFGKSKHVHNSTPKVKSGGNLHSSKQKHPKEAPKDNPKNFTGGKKSIGKVGTM